ncbi:MAG: NAD(P)H-dependent oxidoreductase, partial [Telluria sp.]
GGMHGRPLEDFLAPIEQTARACGMDWLAPHVYYGADAAGGDAAAAHAEALRARLAAHAGLSAATGVANGT